MRAGFCGLIFFPAPDEIVFHERLKFTRTREDRQKRFENGFKFTRIRVGLL